MLELGSDFFGRKMECVGVGISGGEPPWAHEAGGAPCRGGRALEPRGQVLAPPAVFSMPDILKYSKKNHYPAQARVLACFAAIFDLLAQSSIHKTALGDCSLV